MINKISKIVKSFVTGNDSVMIPKINEIIDSINNSAPNYKIYRAIVTNDGLNPPTVNVLENTLGSTLTWGGLASAWTLTADSNVFTTGKVFANAGGSDATNGTPFVYSFDYSLGENILGFNSYDLTGTSAHIGVYNTPIEIRVYN